jgi:hypothetical protein
MKMTAYRSEFGKERIYASEHQKERNELTGGGPLGGFIAWSLDPPGQRKKLKHVRRGKPHFEYISKSDSDTVGGESLDHLLFKEAISEIKRTHLTLNGGERFPITITNSYQERQVDVNENYYRIDVHLEFESQHVYAEKWSGQIYFEVCHKNPVHKEKKDDLASLDLPVIEYKLRAPFFYPHDESNTSRAREEKHKAMIKRILEGDTGFVPAKVLHDPSSAPYLKRELEERSKELTEANSAVEKLKADFHKLSSSKNEALSDNISLKRLMGESNAKIETLEEGERTLQNQLSVVCASHAKFKKRSILSGLAATLALTISIFVNFYLWQSIPTENAQATSLESSHAQPQSTKSVPQQPKFKHATKKKQSSSHSVAATVDQ